MQEKRWWRNEVVYQIYPRSFQDSNGDGIGDLQGIISKVDYLKSLGIGIVWLGPIFQSPNDDNGYDVSDYYSIMKEFGTMEDFDCLLETYHRAGIRVILDIVVNHTSDEHPWFIEAKQSRDNPYRDYYIWRDPKDGHEPCNWESVFSGSVWRYEEETGQYVLHLYSRKQIDLNWETEAVRQEVYKLSKFWLDKGVDGFRLDTITTISKDMNFPDAPVVNKGHEFQPAVQYYMDGPEIMRYLREYKEKVLKNYNVVIIGETPGCTPKEALEYLDEDTGAMDLAIQWEHIEKDPGSGEKWDNDFWTVSYFKKIMTKWQTELYQKAWNVLYLSNHDQPRQVSRFGDTKKYHKESAKMLATCMHMMQGTPFVYQGEEIGMTNVAFDDIEQYRCVETRNMYAAEIERGENREEVMARIHKKSRDNARTPMQWDDGLYAGFSTAEPWIGVNANYVRINVKQQMEDENSILRYYQRLIALRKKLSVITEGKYELLMPEDEAVFAYSRIMGDEKLLVLTNFSGQDRNLDLDASWIGGRLIISNYKEVSENNENQPLRPYEARVYYWGKQYD